MVKQNLFQKSKGVDMGNYPVSSVVSKLSKVEAYEKIRTYCVRFAEMWVTMSDEQKSNYVFGNGRRCPNFKDYIEPSIPLIMSLPRNPTQARMEEVAFNVSRGRLEYMFHDVNKEDQNPDLQSVKMAEYASHIL